MRGKPDAKWRLEASKMPPLRKRMTGHDYEIERDQVYLWMSRQPGIMQMAFDKMHEAGLIVYDKATETWRGRDYDA